MFTAVDSFFNGLFTMLGKRYEMQVYERARRANIQAQRDVLKLGIVPDDEAATRLDNDIKLTERLLAVLAEFKSK